MFSEEGFEDCESREKLVSLTQQLIEKLDGLKQAQSALMEIIMNRIVEPVKAGEDFDRGLMDKSIINLDKWNEEIEKTRQLILNANKKLSIQS